MLQTVVQYREPCCHVSCHAVSPHVETHYRL